MPKSKGGRDVLENLLASCGPCNSKRGDRDLIRTTWFNTRWLDALV
ncbi:HNH endonuclease [Streptomyces albidoflavus]